MSVPAVDRLAMSRLRFHACLLSTPASASGSRVQAEPAFRPDPAIPRLRLFGLYEGGNHRQASSPRIHSRALSVGLVGADVVLLGLPQHAVVPVRFVTGDIFRRSLLTA